MKFVEVELAEMVDVFAGDREEQSREADPRSVAVRASMLNHHLVEPCFHARARFAALPVSTVVPFDAARNSAEADFFSFPGVAFDLCVRR
jgi:hypothetical protein